MGIENTPQPQPSIERAESASEKAEFGQPGFVDIELYNTEAKRAMEGLYRIINNNLKIDPNKKNDLWKAVEQQIDIEVGEMKNDLNRMAETHTNDLMTALADKQVQVLTMIQEMRGNLTTQLTEASDWGVITNDEVDEIAANAEMLLPIEVRGLTKSEREQLGKQKSYASRLLAEAPKTLYDITVESASTILVPPKSKEALAVLEALTVGNIDRAIARKTFKEQGFTGEELELRVNQVQKPFGDVLNENWKDAAICLICLIPAAKIFKAAKLARLATATGKTEGVVIKHADDIALASDQVLESVLKENGGKAWEKLVEKVGLATALSTAKQFWKSQIPRIVETLGGTARNVATGKGQEIGSELVDGYLKVEDNPFVSNETQTLPDLT